MQVDVWLLQRGLLLEYLTLGWLVIVFYGVKEGWAAWHGEV